MVVTNTTSIYNYKPQFKLWLKDAVMIALRVLKFDIPIEDGKRIFDIFTKTIGYKKAYNRIDITTYEKLIKNLEKEGLVKIIKRNNKFRNYYVIKLTDAGKIKTDGIIFQNLNTNLHTYISQFKKNLFSIDITTKISKSKVTNKATSRAKSRATSKAKSIAKL